MPVVAVLIIGLILAFGLVVLFGPPYVPTLARQKVAALDLLDLKPGQTLLEIGSGDGRVMRAAAKRGLMVVGIELNPVLVVVSRVVTWRYRKQVRVIWGNVWQVTWPPADGVFTFFLPRFMARLDHRLQDWQRRPFYLASFAFRIPGKKPVATRRGIFLYKYN